MKLSSGQFGRPHRIISDEYILRQCVFGIPFKRSNITVLRADTNRLIITLQVEYKCVDLLLTYSCESVAEATEFVDKMIARCPATFTKMQTLKFTKMLTDNSQVAQLEPPKMTFKTVRVNSPL